MYKLWSGTQCPNYPSKYSEFLENLQKYVEERIVYFLHFVCNIYQIWIRKMNQMLFFVFVFWGGGLGIGSETYNTSFAIL